MIGALAIMAALAFLQNAAFTWSSRSRNSGDPSYHRWAAITSNSVWFATNGMIFTILAPVMKGEAGIGWLIAAGIVYTLATTEGSVYMMRRLIRSETGKRKVGS